MYDEDKTMDTSKKSEKQTIYYQNKDSILNSYQCTPSIDYSNVNYDAKTNSYSFSNLPQKNFKLIIISLIFLAFFSLLGFAGLICLMIIKLKDSVIGLVLVGLATLALLAIFLYSMTFLIIKVIEYHYYKRNNIIDCYLANNNAVLNSNTTQYSSEIRDIYTNDDASMNVSVNTSVHTHDIPMKMTQTQILLSPKGFFPSQPCPIKPNSFKSKRIPSSPSMHPPPGVYPSQNGYQQPYYLDSNSGRVTHQ